MRTLRSYSLLVRWQALRLKGFLPLAIVVQVLFAFGIVVGYPLLFPDIDQLTILYLATGAPAITLITMGLVALPQVVAQAKLEGTLEYMRSLPVSRLVFLAADITVWLAIVLPGVVFAVVVGRLGLRARARRVAGHHPGFAARGHHGSGSRLRPRHIAAAHDRLLLTQVLVIGVLVFSPINFPAERLPEWLQAVHSILPVGAMGEVIRGSLAASDVPAHRGTVPTAGRLVPRGARPHLSQPAPPRLTVPPSRALSLAV